MIQLGVQTKNIIEDEHPETGFEMIREAGFTCADFSLNSYLKNSDIYQSNLNQFFDQPIRSLEEFFLRHKQAAKKQTITIHQMHMPYPIFVPNGKRKLNEYLLNQVAPKSMEICNFFECPYIVIHGFKLANYLGSEEKEWEQTERFIHSIAPIAKELGITICIENLYGEVGGHIMEGPCCNIGKIIERIDRINEKYKAEVIGFCLDTGHANLVGLEMEKIITKLDYRLKVLHIHDNDGINDLHQLPFTFTKTRENNPSTDWGGFIRGLQNIKFNKVLSFETAPVLDSFPKTMKLEALSFIACIGKHFEKQL